MPGALEQLDPAVRHRGGGGGRVPRRDHPVLGAPHDQRRDGRGVGQVVVGVDALAAGVDHGPGGGQEGAAGVGIAERGEAVPDLGEVTAGPQPHRAEHPSGRGDPVTHPSRRDDRQHVLGAGQGGRAQQRADLAAEPAAGDEHEPVDPLGEEVGEDHRDAAAQRVPDQGHLGDAELVEQVAQGGRVRAQRVVADRLRGLAVAEQVGHDQPVVVVEPVDEVAPTASASPGCRG